MAAVTAPDHTPQTRAQALVDLGVRLQARQAEKFAQQVEAWRSDASADSGARESAAAAAAKFGGQPYAEFLEASGLLHHPAHVAAWARVAQLVSQDPGVSAVPNTGAQPKPFLEVMYPKTPPKR